MSDTVLLKRNADSNGKSKFKIKGLSKAQIEVVKKNKGNLIKGISLIGGSVLAYSAFNYYKSDINEKIDDVIDSGTISFDTNIEFADGNFDNMSFGEAFSQAREMIGGGGGFFNWNGASYHTFTKEEWDEMSDEDKQQFFEEISDNINFDTAEVEEIEDEYNYEESDEINDEDNKEESHTETVEKDEVEDTLEKEDLDDDLIDEAIEDAEDQVLDEDVRDYLESEEIIVDLNDEDGNQGVVNNDEYVDNFEDFIEEDDSGKSFVEDTDDDLLDEDETDDDLIEEEDDEVENDDDEYDDEDYEEEDFDIDEYDDNF